LARADAADASEHVVADTFLRFKGLERPFVIVTELVHGEGMKYHVRMHIALTRATSGVIVVCDEDAVGRDPRLAAVAGKK
ncbi:MAG: ATP-binding domain-containing protein, partial [Polyangia bacterium]